MNFVSDDIVDILHNAEIGVIGQDLFVAPPIPTTPDCCITIWDTGSTNEPDPNYLDYRYPTFQVRVRGEKEDRKKAVRFCNEIRNHLHYWQGVVLNRRYLYILVMSEPVYIGYDELSRSLFSINFRTQLAPFNIPIKCCNNEKNR